MLTVCRHEDTCKDHDYYYHVKISETHNNILNLDHGKNPICGKNNNHFD